MSHRDLRRSPSSLLGIGRFNGLLDQQALASPQLPGLSLCTGSQNIVRPLPSPLMASSHLSQHSPARSLMPFPNSNHRLQKIDADNPRSSKQSFQSQFEKVISNPILQLNLSPARRSASLPTWVVVDSLDECDD